MDVALLGCLISLSGIILGNPNFLLNFRNIQIIRHNFCLKDCVVGKENPRFFYAIKRQPLSVRLLGFPGKDTR